MPNGEVGLEALRRYVDERGRHGRWLVLTHDNPDPDALASAQVLARVLRGAFGLRVTAAYGGIVGRAENQEMVRTLKLELSHVRRLAWKNYKHFALVDTQPRTGNNQLPKEIVPDLVVDHHPVRPGVANVPLADVRPEVGATATIVGEYLLASGLTVHASDATALAYAIRTETRDFGRETSPRDRKVFDAIYPSVRKRALARIQHPRLPLGYFRTLHRALERLQGVDNLVVSHLGPVDQPDIVPEIADLLLRMEGKTWSLCTGRFQERLYLSIRTTNSRADAGNVMRRLVGARGRGGGHGMTAGGWIKMVAEPARLEAKVTERLAHVLKRSPEKIAPLLPPAGSTSG